MDKNEKSEYMETSTAGTKKSSSDILTAFKDQPSSRRRYSPKQHMN